MAVKYIKTKITHIRLADPELRLLPIPLPPLTLQVARTHDVAGGGGELKTKTAAISISIVSRSLDWPQIWSGRLWAGLGWAGLCHHRMNAK